MNIRKMNEFLATLADINAQMTSEYIRSVIDIKVTPEEVQYMKDHWRPSKYQINLINTYFAKYYGNYRDTKLIDGTDFYTNALLIKKKLIIDAGRSIDDDLNDMAILPYILTANLEGRDNSRIIRSNKYISNIEEDAGYRELCESDYSLLLQIHPDQIKDIIGEFTQSRFTFVTPENDELLGFEIVYDENKLGSELISFMHSFTK